ncbi:MAG: DUF4198 domain-containing protein [Myxococcales bacterium FL481]|nr:MAG: DUF4198 domain-containing protein [Myxococcales bacterium FL481]
MLRNPVVTCLVAAMSAAPACLPAATSEAEPEPEPAHEPTSTRGDGNGSPLAARRLPTLIQTGRGAALRLRAGVGTALELQLDPQVGFDSSSRDSALASMNVGRFVARIPGGKQISLASDELQRTGRASFSVDRPGAAMVMLCVGPDGADASDAWQRVTHCAKTIYRVDGADGARPSEYEDPGILSKTGIPLEILPIMSPLHVRPGSDMGVRAYLFGHAGPDRRVVALRPDGSRDVQTTNRVGLANFRITQPGPWVIRVEADHQGRHVIGELVFAVEAPPSPKDAG